MRQEVARDPAPQQISDDLLHPLRVDEVRLQTGIAPHRKRDPHTNDRMPSSELIWAVLDPAGLTRYSPSLLGFEETLKMLPDLHARRSGTRSPRGREKVAAWTEAEQINPEAGTLHLANAVKRLGKLQAEFRARFALHAPAIATLDRREAETLWTLWAVWYDLAFHPRRRLANAARDSVAAIESRLDERRRALRRRLRSLTLSKTDVLTARGRGAVGAGLWLTVDVAHVQETVNGFAEALVHVIDVLRPPADFHAFDRYALDLVWEHVHLVPLVFSSSDSRGRTKI